MSASFRACASRPSKKFVVCLSPFNRSKHALAAEMASSLTTRATQASPLATRAACKHVWDKVEAWSQTPANGAWLHSNAARPAPIVGSSKTMEAFARPAWRVVAYFAINWRRSSLLAFGVLVDGGGARRRASAALASAARAASMSYAQRCARASLRAASCERCSAVRPLRVPRRRRRLRSGSAMHHSSSAARQAARATRKANADRSSSSARASG